MTLEGGVRRGVGPRLRLLVLMVRLLTERYFGALSRWECYAHAQCSRSLSLCFVVSTHATAFALLTTSKTPLLLFWDYGERCIVHSRKLKGKHSQEVNPPSTCHAINSSNHATKEKERRTCAGTTPSVFQVAYTRCNEVARHVGFISVE